MSAFPSLSVPQDSSKYTVSAEDPAMRVESDAGYTITRARFTRKPRKTWKVGYTMLKPSDRALLEAHWDTARGGSVVFTWANSQDGQTYSVRYKDTMEFSYAGVGLAQLWNCSMTLTQA